MSVFSNKAEGAAGDRGAYIAAVMELLGTEEPLGILSSTVSWCREATVGVSEEQLATPEGAGKWSVNGVLQHLADSELVWGYRLRMVLAEDRPVLSGYDQDRWATRLSYNVASREDAIEVFSVLRAANLRLLSNTTAIDLERVGIHNERGEESVRHMVRLYAGHDLVHRRQLARMISGGPHQ